MSGQWKLKGSYFEACNCEVACPCVLLGAPPQGECTVLIAWHIESGNFEMIGLDGLNMALAVHAPGHMLETKWKAALYVDDRATLEQCDALTKIFAGQAGGHLAKLSSYIGEVLGVKAIPIEYRAEGRRRYMTVDELAEMDIEAVPGQQGAEVTLAGMPFCVVPGIPAVVGRSKRLSYRDYGLRWEITDKNGFYSRFEYRG